MGEIPMFRIVNRSIALIELSALLSSGIAVIGWIVSHPEPTLAHSEK
jgi:hypothetical protein